MREEEKEALRVRLISLCQDLGLRTVVISVLTRDNEFVQISGDLDEAPYDGLAEAIHQAMIEDSHKRDEGDE